MSSQRRILYLLLVVAATSLQAADPLVERILDNGLQVVIAEKHSVPLVTVDFVFKSGSFAETEEDNGLANLHANMLFKATPAYSTQENYLTRARGLGMILETHATAEWVSFRITLPADSLEQGLRFIEESIRYPSLSVNLLEQAEKTILDAMDLNATDPRYQLLRAVQTKLWGSNIYQKNYQGTGSVISSLSLEQVRLVHELYFIPNNAALLISGDVNPRDAFRLTEDIFGRWRANRDPTITNPIVPILPLAVSSDTVIIQPINTAEIVIAWHGPSTITDLNGILAGNLLSCMLNCNSSSFQKNLVASGIALKAEVIQTPRRYISQILIKVTCLRDSFWVAYQTLQDELDKIEAPAYFTIADLNSAKRLLEMETYFQREITPTFLRDIARWWAMAGFDYYQSYLDNLKAISHEDIVDYVARYISYQPSVTGAMINRQAQQQLQVAPGTLTR